MYYSRHCEYIYIPVAIPHRCFPIPTTGSFSLLSKGILPEIKGNENKVTSLMR